jgi:hypothetical protein
MIVAWQHFDPQMVFLEGGYVVFLIKNEICCFITIKFKSDGFHGDGAWEIMRWIHKIIALISKPQRSLLALIRFCQAELRCCKC